MDKTHTKLRSWDILVVEDDEDDFILAKAWLTMVPGSKFALRWAATYENALEQVQAAPPDAILMDYDLGAYNGLDVTHELHRQGYLTPIIFLTGRGSYELDLEAMHAGAVDYLAKSEATPALLERTIRYAIERGQFQTALNQAQENLEARVREQTAALQAEKETLALVLAKLPGHAVILCDAQGCIQEWNQAAESLYGWRRSEAIGQELDRLVKTSYPESSRTELQRELVETGEAHTELVHFHRDGSPRYVEASIAGFADANGDPARFIYIFWDITSQKLGEDRMYQDQRRLKAVAELSWNVSRSEPTFDTACSLTARAIVEAQGGSCAIFASPAGGEWLQPAGYYQPDLYDLSVLRRAINGTTIRLGEGLLGQVAAIGMPRTIADVDQDALRAGDLLPFYPQNELPGCYSLAVLPLRCKDRVLGVVAAWRNRPGNPYLDEEIDFLQNLCDLAGSHLYRLQESQQLHNQLAALQEQAGLERTEAEERIAAQRRLGEVREADSITLSQNLQDGPIQALYNLSYQLDHLQSVEQSQEQYELLETAQKRSREVLSGLREISSRLRPPSLVPFGLERTIKAHAEQFRLENPGMIVSLDLDADGRLLPEQVRLAIYRIYQQAMANVASHAHASRVDVRLALNAREVALEVQDDGDGFHVPGSLPSLARYGHLGLVAALERAESVDGRLEVLSDPGSGTTVRVRVPRKNTQPPLSAIASLPGQQLPLRSFAAVQNPLAERNRSDQRPVPWRERGK